VAGATLSGTITDSQGGTVPNARVVVKNAATGVSAETTTNTTGAYTMPNLNPGDYEATVTAPGFATTVSKLTLTVGAKQEMNIALTVGQVVQTVEVTGAAPQVELQSSTIAGNVSATTVRELPLNGRDWASLATLEPSVVQARTQRSDPTQVGGAGGRGFGNQLSVSGSRPTQNSYRLDGVLVNDYSNAGPGSVLGKNLGVDAIQEFTVLTSNYSAEYGFTSGGVINAITRSGTNSFHGTAFDFVRNDKFDAANCFTNANNLGKNELRQNQFGLKRRQRFWRTSSSLRRQKACAGSWTPVTNGITTPDAVRAERSNLSNGSTVTVARSSQYPAPSFYPHPVTGAGRACRLEPRSALQACPR
jgi:hypothetical protein